MVRDRQRGDKAKPQLTSMGGGRGGRLDARSTSRRPPFVPSCAVRNAHRRGERGRFQKVCHRARCGQRVGARHARPPEGGRRGAALPGCAGPLDLRSPRWPARGQIGSEEQRACRSLQGTLEAPHMGGSYFISKPWLRCVRFSARRRLRSVT
jgi:hypothetical protein